MKNSENFADVFNFFLYGGKQVIKPENLTPVDTASVVLPYSRGDRSVPTQRYRDVLKLAVIMEDGQAAYLLLGIENQSQMHYAMPVRNMLYDAIQYSLQVDRKASKHKKEQNTADTGAEYLSGFYGTDKLIPVVTLTLYFGADEWKAPRDLYGMLSANENILKYISNYKLNLIEPAGLSDEELDSFRTELGLTLKFIKYSPDKQKLNDVVHRYPAFRSVSRNTVELINAVTGSELDIPKGEERIDMCEGIKGIYNDGVAEGIVRGRAEGKAEGKAEGRWEAFVEMYRKGVISLKDAADAAGVTMEEFEEKEKTFEA